MSSTNRKVAVVTGGTGGVGTATARRLAATYDVILGDLSADRVNDTVAQLKSEGLTVTGRVCDVSNHTDVAELASAAAKRGELGLLAHTGGISSSMADAKTILTVNLIGTAIVLDTFLPLAGAGTAAVCIASISGHREKIFEIDELLANPREPGFFERLEARVSLERPGSGYALSKRGVAVMCERRSREWGAVGARLVSVSPGLIDTPMGHLEKGAGAKLLVEMSALGRAASADEIAATVEFLGSAGAGFITGADIRVDGGAVAGFNHWGSDEVRAQWNDPWYADDPWRRVAPAPAI